MRTYIISLCCSIILVFGVFGCAPKRKPNIILTQSGLQGIKKIAVVVEQKNDFEVIHSQAKTNAVAAILGGVAGGLGGGAGGYAIASKIDKDKDNKKAALMANAIQDVCSCSIFIESLAPLRKSAHNKIYILPDANQEADLSGYDAVVTFTIDRWGLCLIERRADRLTAFVKLEAKMVRNRDANAIWEQRKVIFGDGRENLVVYTTNGQMLCNELRQTIKKAGFQMSNELIFPDNPDVSQNSVKTKVNVGPASALNINNDYINIKTGPLSSVKPLKIEIESFADKRQVTDRIGYMRNSIGGKTWKVNTAQPVPEIIREAVGLVFSKSGHIVTSGEKDIIISGSVATYEFDSRMKFDCMEFMGTINVDIVIKDGHTGDVLFSKRYTGYRDQDRWTILPKIIIQEMNAAMENLTDRISFDAELIEVLKTHNVSPAASTIPTQSSSKTAIPNLI